MLDEEAESAATQIISGVGVHGCSSRSSNDCRGRAFRVHAFKSMEKSTARTDVPFPAIRATGAAFVCARPPARPTRVAKGTKGEAKCTKVQHKCIKKVLVSFCHSAALSAKAYQSRKTHMEGGHHHLPKKLSPDYPPSDTVAALAASAAASAPARSVGIEVGPSDSREERQP